MRVSILVAAAIAVLLAPLQVRAETPEEWIKLGTRVHGGYGSFIPLGVKIGLDAVSRLKAEPRTLAVTYFDNPKSPCACFADGVALATLASFGQRSVSLAAEQAPPDKVAVIIIKPRTGGAGFKYSIPMSALPRLGEITKTMDELQRHEAVMKESGLFEVEPVN